MIEKAYAGLFPDKKLGFTPKLRYSRAFRGYNANIKLRGRVLEVSMGFGWKEVSEEIQIGLVQILLAKLFKTRIKTPNIDMYNSFIKNMSKYAKVDDVDPVLEESFHRVNDDYFTGMMDMPNLVWGNKNYRKLGSFDYGTNTITVSEVMRSDENLLDYIMYHELLHKKLKFKGKGLKNYHHTKEFKQLEKKYKDPDVEEKLKSFLTRKRIRKLFWL